MCGIGGFINYKLNNQHSADDLLNKMGSLMNFRGPDFQGVWTDLTAGVGLVHRRLKIIDLSDSANQPMIENDNLLTVFNGEIYNYKELKTELESIGFVFSTQSDTEVLLKGFRKWGKDFISKMDGMFAFAIYNKATGEMFCARDRFGEKPFFYVQKGNSFIFASDISALKAVLAPEECTVNEVYIQEYLKNGNDYLGENTFFNNIKQLLPGNFVLISPTKIQFNTYYKPGINIPQPLKNESDYIEKFRSLFELSVKRRMRSDVKVGTSLSGGLDSSAIACLIAGGFKKNITTVSARFPGTVKDEGNWIDQVTQIYKLENHQVFPSKNDLLNELAEITLKNGRPIGSSSVFAQYKVMQAAARQKCIVMIDGQGADEILMGYKTYRQIYLWEQYRKFKFARFVQVKRDMQRHHPEMKAGFSFLFDPMLHALGVSRDALKKGKTVRQRMLNDLNSDLRVLLEYADRNSMAHSVEVRLPFLFHELVEFMFSVPTSMFYRDGKTKWIMREALKDVLPESIYNRKDKIGYEPPQQEWMKDSDFINLHKNALFELTSNNYLPSDSPWRNISAHVFINVFK